MRDVWSSVARAQDVLDPPERSRVQFPVLPGLGAWGHTTHVQFPVPRGLGHRGCGQGHVGPPCAANQASDRTANKLCDPGTAWGGQHAASLVVARRPLRFGLHGAIDRAVSCREPWSGCGGRHAPRSHVSQCNGLPAEPVCATSEVAVWKAVARCKLFGYLPDHRTSQTKGNPESHHAPQTKVQPGRSSRAMSYKVDR